MSVSIPRNHYIVLLGMAGEDAGFAAAQSMIRTGRGFTHPGDTVGTILCEAHRVDPILPSFAMMGFILGLRTALEDAGVVPPTFVEIMDALPLALKGAYGDSANESMLLELRHSVPEMYGSAI